MSRAEELRFLVQSGRLRHWQRGVTETLTLAGQTGASSIPGDTSAIHGQQALPGATNATPGEQPQPTPAPATKTK